MSPLSRNTRRADPPQRSWALGAMLALSLASGTALAGGGGQFVFTAYVDAVGGGDILAGRYRIALAELKNRPDAVAANPSTANTNLCVAYSMTLQWQEARAECDAAVRAARRRQRMSAGWSWAHTSDDDYLAVAYANRAVLYWLSRDDAAAQKDLARAQELSPRADFVARNVVALGAHRAPALATTSR